MSIETRRFRTWDGGGEATQPWKVILRYSVMRMLRAWHLRLLVVVALLIAIVNLGGHAFSVADQAWGVTYYELIAAAGMGLVATGIFLLFIAAPLFSEDIRFNAPLFYFSKPVTARDYVQGKAVFVGGVLALAVVVPFVIYMLLTLLGAFIAEVPDWISPAEEADFQHVRVTSFQDWLVAAAIMVPGVLVFMVFLASLFIALSAWTRRGWHAAVGAVVAFGGWSILGLTVGEATRTSVGDAFGPMGWFMVMIAYPLEERFETWGPHGTPRYLEHLEIAIPLAYTAAIAASVGLWALTHFRLRRLEGVL